MGFGLLLCGYFAVTVTSVGMGDYRCIAYLLGGILCLKATSLLKAYNPRFLWPLGASIAYLLLGIYEGLDLLDTTFLWRFMPTNATLTLVVDILKLTLNLFFHVGMLWSVLELASSLEIEKIKTAAIRNLIAMGIYAVGEIVILAFPTVAALENQAIPRLLLLYLLVCYLLNSWLLFSCYRNICPAGEENGSPAKPSRFAFVNRLNAKFDERAERAMREQMAYQAEKQAKREQKKKKKH